jgi:hypothetical protein
MLAAGASGQRPAEIVVDVLAIGSILLVLRQRLAERRNRRTQLLRHPGPERPGAEGPDLPGADGRLDARRRLAAGRWLRHNIAATPWTPRPVRPCRARSSLQGSRDASLGGTIQTGSMQRDMGEQLNEQRSTAIPVVQEELKVGKREVQRGGVRVFSRVVETPVNESVNLREEHVNVERRPVDQPISAADTDRLQGTVDRDARKGRGSRGAEVGPRGRGSRGGQGSHPAPTKHQGHRAPHRSAGRIAGRDPGRRRLLPQRLTSTYSSLGGSYDDYAPAYSYGSQMRATRYRTAVGRRRVRPAQRLGYPLRQGRRLDLGKDEGRSAPRLGQDHPDSDSDSYYRSHWTATTRPSAAATTTTSRPTATAARCATIRATRAASGTTSSPTCAATGIPAYGKGGGSTWER